MPSSMNVLVRRRNGDITEFHANKIETALMNAFIGTDPDLKNSQSVHSRVEAVLSKAMSILQDASLLDSLMDVEFIQDCVERALMAADEHAVLRAYILYRESHKKNRQEDTVTDTDKWTVQVKHGSKTKALNVAKIKKVITESCAGLNADSELVFHNFKNSVYNGITNEEVFAALVLAVRPLIETHPDYAYVAARLHFYHLRKEVIGRSVTASEMATVYPIHFKNMIAVGIKNQRIAPEMANFDLDRLGAALRGERDNLFMYQGAQILTDRYFLHVDDRHIELPQTFFMRVAMGLSLLEEDKEDRAIEFYNVLSQFDLVTSTPTLFNAGTLRPQLSSCFLSTVSDDLVGIYDAIKENALLSKYSGGLGNDWTPVRGLGSQIKGTNGKSQGIIPFLKVVNDTAVAVNQGGKRKGAVCVYLETWHIDMEEFLELRKNTGDDRRRTHDMNTANWIPDLFMERVEARGEWTLFSPDEVPDLHDLFGLEFKKRYEHYEKMASKGLIKVHKKVSALEMWRKMLTMLLETGHPWITFKDMCNVRSPQQHVGVVHSSNLCVAPETVVLTDKGHIPIVDLQDKKVKVWNGMTFSDTIVRKTGENQKLITVKLSNGAKLACTPYHIFHIKNDYHKKAVEVRAADLKVGDKLIKAEYPIINNHEWEDFKDAYTHGFFCGDGTYGKPDYKKPIITLYGDKKELLPFLNVRTGSNKETANGVLNYSLHATLEQKFTVPTSHSLKSRVEWFAGLCDADGCITKNGSAYGIQIGSIHADFLENVRLMLQTMGIYSAVALMSENRRNLLPDGKGGNNVYECQDLYRLLIAHDGLIMLNRLGFNPHRLIMPTNTTQRRSEHFVTVVSIADTGRVDDTYCFSEPIRHMGVFNGVLTGQCTEITLNSTSDTETAVCNLASINLVQHMKPRSGQSLGIADMFDTEKMERTIKTGMRMLDNVVDLNYYAIDKARNSNTQHHPVGLGVMGFVDAMAVHRISYNSMSAVEFADVSQELISYYAISASADLARERGSYSSFDGSLWSKGILPIDSLEMMEAIRHIDVDRKRTMDWDSLRTKVKGGMRNSNCLAIAPTATIANIIGVSQGIEPIYQNLYVKSNLSGEFTVLNPSMVKDMMELGIWDAAMIMDLKFFDGSLSKIDRVPQELKDLYVTAFEMDPMYLVECAARRQKWIDQSQSVNIYFNNPKGKMLDTVYTQAWKKGLKTTYYLRSLSATSAEKSTGKAGALNAVKSTTNTAPEPKSCLIDDPTCEACQ